jgi:hypothetical protein
MQITIDQDAARYIHARTGAVVIGLQFEPALGGCACSRTRITGSYIPVLSLGRPAPDEADQYQSRMVETVEVHFPPSLTVKQGLPGIRIRLRGRLWFRWLELEGAQGIAKFDA